jgi:hypothetical protein
MRQQRPPEVAVVAPHRFANAPARKDSFR